MQKLARLARSVARALGVAIVVAFSIAILAGALVLGLVLLVFAIPVGAASAPTPTLAARPAPTPRPFVSWSPARPAATPTPAPAPMPTPLPLRYCGASDLAASAGYGAAGGTTYSAVLIANTSSTPCQLFEVPRVIALDANGRAIRLPQQGFDAAGPPSPVRLDPSHATPMYRTAETAPAGDARLQVAWRVRCGESLRSASLDIWLDQGGVLRVALPAAQLAGLAGACSKQPSRIGVFGFEPSVYPSTPMPTPPPLILRASIEAPASVTNDRPLRYFVTLTNATSTVFRFGECPVYSESFVKNVRRYYLNCEAVGPLAPGESATFEMVLELDPRLTPHEPAWQLRWWLEPFPNSAEATATVAVTRALRAWGPLPPGPSPTRAPKP